MPITSVPVDQGAFTRMMLESIEPKCDRDTGVQFTNKDGTERKWAVSVVAAMPSHWDANRQDKDILQVTVTCAEDPRDLVTEGDQVWFEDFSAGVTPTDVGDNGKARGGRLFWSATAVQSRNGAKVKS